MFSVFFDDLEIIKALNMFHAVCVEKGQFTTEKQVRYILDTLERKFIEGDLPAEAVYSTVINCLIGFVDEYSIA